MATPELFRGTGYDPSLVQAISTDINATVARCRTLYPRQNPGNPPCVCLSGTIPIQMPDRRMVQCPVSILLMPGFPKTQGPVVRVDTPRTVRLRPTPVMDAQGLIRVDAIPWVFRQSMLSTYVDQLSRLLTAHPPFGVDQIPLLGAAPQPQPQAQAGPQQNKVVEECAAVADGIVEEANRAANEAYLTRVEYETLKHTIETIGQIQKTLQTEIDAVNGRGNGKITVPPEIEERADIIAKEKASRDAILELQNELATERITADDFQTQMRNMTRQHFKDYIWPMLDGK